MEVTYASSDTAARLKGRFAERRLEAALAEKDDESVVPFWYLVVAGWLLHKTPRNFGSFRSRWTCKLMAELLRTEHGIDISGDTVRRGLHKLGFARRRPRPIVGPDDPDYDEKLRRIKRRLATLPGDEAAVFQDEVDVHLNRMIGSQWMPVGRQATVEAPSNNVKRHVAGSLMWQTGTPIVSPPGKARNAETNPIERVWWHFHEIITRNHRCETLDELLELAYT
jgi:transposase